MAQAKGNGGTKSAQAGEQQISSQRKGPPRVAVVAEADIERLPDETDQDCKCRGVRERYMLDNGENEEEKELVSFF